MAVFNIIRTDDPARHRDQILRFWQAYLPGTPPERLAWMNSGNPAGAAVWFLAFEKGRDELAGTATLMPRRMYHADREIRAGILGDFMVDERYRVFGPNLQLLRAALGSQDDLGLAFIYTIPNTASLKVAERVGIREITALRCLARPLDLRFYLGKYLSAPLAAALAPAAGLALRLSSRETRLRRPPRVVETAAVGESFERFWELIRRTAHGLIGDRSAAYLRWRYLHNPLSRFRILVCDGGNAAEFGGYAVFCVSEGSRMEIYDIAALDKARRDALVKRLIAVGRAERRQALYFYAPAQGWRSGELHPFRFLDTKDTLHLCCFGDPGMFLCSPR